MADIHRLLQRQATWQKARKLLSWPEKIRMAEGIRDSARQLRATRDEREEDRREDTARCSDD
jgi:hypothetical protein